MNKRVLSLTLVLIMCLSLLPMTALAADTPSSWAETDVNKAIAAKLVPQALQSNYSQVITRAEFTALAVALYETVTGKEITERTKFNDTTDINVEKAASIGVVSGVGNNNFSPNTGLTREQAATMLSRLADSVGKPLTKQAATFADNGSISSWALEAVGQIQAAGVMSGVGNNTFAPKNDYTREQSIMTVLRLYDVVKGGSAQTTTPAISYKDYGVSSLIKIPDFGEVIGVKCIGEKVEAYSASYYYTYRYSFPEEGWVKKYDEAIRQAGFEWGPYSSAKTDGEMLAHENRTGEKRNINWKDSNDTWVYLYSKQENGAGVSFIELRIQVPVANITSTNVYSTIQTFAQEKGYAVYDNYPEVPDLGAIFGITPVSHEAVTSKIYSYRYDLTDLGEAAKRVLNLSYTSANTAMDHYWEILVECGFTKTLKHNIGGDNQIYYEGYGYSITWTIPAIKDSNYLGGHSYISPNCSLIIQKL